MREGLFAVCVVTAVLGIASVALQVPLVRTKRREIAALKAAEKLSHEIHRSSLRDHVSGQVEETAATADRQSEATPFDAQRSPATRTEEGTPDPDTGTARSDAAHQPSIDSAGGGSNVNSGWTVIVEVGGRKIPVTFPDGYPRPLLNAAPQRDVIRRKPKPRRRDIRSSAATGDSLTAPMQGVVVKVAVEDGQEVAAGELVAVLEAMKMENPVTAHKDGVITALVEPGVAITQGSVIAEIK